MPKKKREGPFWVPTLETPPPERPSTVQGDLVPTVSPFPPYHELEHHEPSQGSSRSNDNRSNSPPELIDISLSPPPPLNDDLDDDDDDGVRVNISLYFYYVCFFKKKVYV